MIELNITEHDWNQTCAELTGKDIQTDYNLLVDEIFDLAREIDYHKPKQRWVIPGFRRNAPSFIESSPVKNVYFKEDGEWKPVQRVFKQQSDGEWKLIWENPNVGEKDGH